MQYYQQQQAAKVGGLFDTIFNTVDKVLPLALGSLQGLTSPTSGTAARGLAQITAFCNQVITALQQLLDSAPSAPEQPTLATAGQLVAALSDSSQVYQAKSGDDAAKLSQTKTLAGQLLQQIQAKYQTGNVSTNTTTTTVPVTTVNSSGQLVTTNVPVPVSQQGNPLAALTQNPTLLIVAGVGLVAILIAKK
jgi:hypothetical protein